MQCLQCNSQKNDMWEITFRNAFLKPKIIKLKNDDFKVAEVEGEKRRKIRQKTGQKYPGHDARWKEKGFYWF